MKRLRNHLIGIEQGEHVLFSDFEDDGPMWSGEGPRHTSSPVTFTEPFRDPPTIHINLSMWDMDTNANARVDIKAEAITPEGFNIVFHTWGDSRIARARANWTAIGELKDSDEWEL